MGKIPTQKTSSLGRQRFVILAFDCKSAIIGTLFNPIGISIKRIPLRSATLALALLLTACSGYETRPSAIDTFVAGDYHYYRWSNKPLVNTSNSDDLIYTLDPVLRTQLAKELQNKGYSLDPQRAEFTVNYVYAERIRLGERSDSVSNLGSAPGSFPNRNLDQASIDNAYALGGVKETSNIGIIFRDIETNAEV